MKSVACIAAISVFLGCRLPVDHVGDDNVGSGISSFGATFYTGESDDSLGLVLVAGGTGHAWWMATSNNCLLGPPPCPVYGTTPAAWSSDPGVVAWNGLPTFAGVAPGGAFVGLALDGYRDSAQVTVVRELLPIDDIALSVGYVSPSDSASIELDSTGNLSRLTLPALGFADISVFFVRGTHWGLTDSWSYESSDTTVVASLVHRPCDPSSSSWPCELGESAHVVALAPGSTTLRFSMRNATRDVAVLVPK